jgi:hypothetical protein
MQKRYQKPTLLIQLKVCKKKVKSYKIWSKSAHNKLHIFKNINVRWKYHKNNMQKRYQKPKLLIKLKV